MSWRLGGGDALPGEHDWRWEVQLAAERVMSPLRALVVAFNTAVWLLAPRPAHTVTALAWALVAAGPCFVVLDAVLLRRRASLPRRNRGGSVAFDLAYILAWVAATGGSRSPYTPLLLLGAVSAPLRLPAGAGILTTAIYTGASAAMSRTPEHVVGAFSVLVIGVLATRWAALTYRERRNGLRDPLTGALGREYALFRIRQLARDHRFPFTVAIVDLDGFKQVNDRYGHGAGDIVLAQAVRTMAGLLRPGDLLARIGGDEFLVVWPDTTIADAARVAERLRERIAAADFRLRDPYGSVRLTVSVGVTEACEGAGGLGDLLRRADAMLYRAKESEGGVVCDAAGQDASGRVGPAAVETPS